MTNKLSISILLFFILTFPACGQNLIQKQQDFDYAKMELKIALSDTIVHNVIDNKALIVKDSKTAINIVEPILFSIYGRDQIIDEKPYISNLIDKYWVIKGTLHSEHGGVFLIIIDATNSKIIRLTHGK